MKLNGPGRYRSDRENFLAVGEAFWPAPGFREKTFDISGVFISASAVPHCGEDRGERKKFL